MSEVITALKLQICQKKADKENVLYILKTLENPSDSNITLILKSFRFGLYYLKQILKVLA